MRRRDHRLKYLILGLFVAVGSLTFLIGRLRSDEVDAASLANFDPGFIISDYTMSNYNSMTQAEIQAFLTSKNPCNNRDYSYYQALSASNPNVQWHWKDGHFVCISEELFGDGMVIGEGKTAAQIIYETAQEYKINPQVLLVLIQKESSLITDPIPNNYDYRTMTGFGCPDTAPCDAKYFGFKNQIRKAAWLFREVLDGGWTNYPLGENYVQYNPNAGCGGSIVNIRSLATSALYRYTPYQPNAGAIAAGYGTAYCGAYGNRNFYLYFEDWFGGITLTYKKSEIEEQLEERQLISTVGRRVSEEQSGLKDGASFQLFENAVVYKHPTLGTHAVMTGTIRDLYRSYGLENGTLGYPTSEAANGYQEFENAIIDNQNLFSKNIYKEYINSKEVFGEPQNNIICGLRGNGCYQIFKNGIVYDSTNGVFIVGYEILDKFRLRNRESGIGYPTSNLENDIQHFENGDIEL